MACGCKSKKKRAERAAESASVEYKVNGGTTVPLGMSNQIRLPVRLPGAIDGQDLVVAQNKLKIPQVMGAVIVVGRNAQVEERHKQQLVDKWPTVFNG